jgi:two-component system, NarL family, nitrate/nitrite response regulator NarL
VPTVLIVDDYASVRSAIRVGLERHSGFSVCGEAADGVDAIDKAAKLHPDFVLLDLSMPGMSGVETACALKGLIPRVRIIVFTLYAELLGRSLPSALGIDAVIDKLDGIRKLVECVRKSAGSDLNVECKEEFTHTKIGQTSV